MTVKVRFAPSPTGLLHLGNIKAAVINWLYTRAAGGKFMLRIDDTDLERSTKEFEDAIRSDMNWLGLTWDETAKQSERQGAYDAAVEQLKASGHLYACYETGEELERKRGLQRASGRPPVYDRAGLKLTDEQRQALEAEGRRPHWRFKLDGARESWNDLVRGEQEVDTASLSDPVLIREDGRALYTLSSVVDDGHFGITHIIRGEDHVSNTAAQVQLFRALGYDVPTFGHFALIVDADGAPLSKRAGSLTIGALAEKGIEAPAIVSLLARLGTPDPVVAWSSASAAVEEFDLGRFGRAAARFDDRELERLSAQILHEMPFSEAADRLSVLEIEGIDEALWGVARPNLTKLADIADWRAVVREPVEPVIADEKFAATAASLLPEGELTEESWKAWTDAVKAETGAKGKSLFMPLRQALTGREHGPEMKKLLPLIGRDRIAKRLQGIIA